MFPQAIATGYIHIGTMTGKLNGVIPATTPSGSRNENTSTPADTWSEYSPFNNVGSPQANSTTSRPRWSSLAASETTFPCSSAITSASRCLLPRTRFRNSNRISVRLLNDVCDQVSNAPAAAATASSTSDVLASSTSACTCPVAGLNTGAVRVEPPSTGLPPIQCEMIFTRVLSVATPE